VKLTIVRGGGFAGLVTTTIVDTEALPPEDAKALVARVEQAGVLDLPHRGTRSTRQPDRSDYAVTVEDEGRKHTVLLGEEDLPAGVDSLISWASSLPDREERIEPLGPGLPLG
jgi:hypothetical protein